MISPLKTWKHQEPKGLWPALGGLAVVAHVGVLGLSLPYMLELMEPDGPSAQSTVPIELVDVENEATAEEAAASAESTPKPEQTEPEQAEPAQASTPEPSQPVKTETTPATSNSTVVAESGNTTTSQTTESSTSQNTESTETQNTNESEAADERPESNEKTVEEPTDPSENETPSEESNESETSGDSDESDNDGGRNEGTAEPEETPEEEVPPVVSGESDLPSPDSSENTSAESFAYLNIVGHEYVPIDLQRDLSDTPPSPLYEAGTSRTINPRDTRCGQVDFSQQQVTYRVTIGKEGSLIRAIPWTGGIEEQPMSTGESAIACLLTSADFSFNPATKEGDPVASSNLLLKINVLESQQN